MVSLALDQQHIEFDEAVVTVLVLLIPLSGLLVAYAVRARPARNRWAAAVAVAGLQVLLLTFLARSLPLESQLTTWSPAELFHGRVVLILDPAAWGLALTAASIFGAQLLLAADRREQPSSFEVGSSFLYLALATAAFLAGNLLTVALTWAAVDAVAYLYHLRAAEDAESIRQHTHAFMRRGASTLVIVAGAIPEAAGGGGPVTQTLEVAVLSGAFWLRCALWPLDQGRRVRERASILAGMDHHMPAVMALGALAHGLGGAAVGSLAAVLILIGAVNAAFGGLLVVMPTGRKHHEGRDGWIAAVGGAALLTMVGPRAPQGVEFAWWGLVLMVAGGTRLWLRDGIGWSRWVRALAAVAMVIGVVLLQSRPSEVEAILSAGTLQWLPALMTLLAALLLAVGAIGSFARTSPKPVEAEPFVQRAAAIASVLPLMSVIGALALFAGAATRLQLALSVVALVLLGLATYSLRYGAGKRLTAAVAGAEDAFVAVSERFTGLVRSAAAAGERFLTTIGAVLEGRAALIWMLVVVLGLALSSLPD